ncbi:MAG: nucleotidyltransferase [Bacilli bacterium]|nr:nucleotidyltransferase [Bacilli bacterium]
MEVIGIICEYNPFHYGHKYHINKIKELYKDSLIILVLNGYFLQRGDASILTKEDKVKIALENNIDLVVEHPFIFASNSADDFAESAITILNHLKVNKIIFGSESNNIDLLVKIAKEQLSDTFNQKLKENLKKGISYPTAVNNSLSTSINLPNDLLGISYVKSIIKNNFNIKPITIKRTNDYHDLNSNEKIVSASNIREKYKNNVNVDKYTNYKHLFQKINEALLFNLLKYKISTDHDLSLFLTVDEGIEYKLIKEIKKSDNLKDFINNVKSKRYTHNRIKRMLVHILTGLTKQDKYNTNIEYIKVLGFNQNGSDHLNHLRKISTIPIKRKIEETYLAQKYELKAALIYDLLTGSNAYYYESQNKPTKKQT